MSDPAAVLQLPAAQLAARIRRRELRAVDLVDAVLDRIESRGDELGAFSVVDASGARAAAIDADRAVETGEGGPLTGVPISIKDSFDVQGLRASSGRLSTARVSATDAPVVRRLREAGAIMVGKTTVPDYLMDRQVVSEFGVTRNPWDPDRTPGGSSTGAAAAVAAGMSAIDLGSDLAGSLRMPASWTGLFGHKPSTGIVSKRSHMPWPEGGALEPLVSAVGPFARSASDLSVALEAMVGVEGVRSRGWRIELPAPRRAGLRGLRVGLWLEDEVAPVDSETRDALTVFAAALAHNGAHVTTVAPPGVGIAGEELFAQLMASEVVHGFDDEKWDEYGALAAQDDGYAAQVRQSFRSGIAAMESQAILAELWAETVFVEHDVLLCPATPCTAPPLVFDVAGDRRVDIDGTLMPENVIGSWSRLAMLGHGAVTVVPLGPGRVSGLPVGAQIVGCHLDDRTTLSVARAAESAGILGYRVPPGWS